MVAIIITTIIGVTAVTIYAMHCANDRANVAQKAIATELAKVAVEKAVQDGE